MSGIEVREVASRRERKLFLRLPWRIYRGDPNWVPPLLSSVDHTLSPRHSPFYDHAESRFYLAWRGGEPVGRIAATVDHLYNECHHDTAGLWGFLECENDPEAARALLDRAADDLRSRGMTSMISPMDPSINGECGLLVEGFAMPPAILMPYNPTYYPALVAHAGLEGAKDLLAYFMALERLTPESEQSQRAERLVALIRSTLTVGKFLKARCYKRYRIYSRPL